VNTSAGIVFLGHDLGFETADISTLGKVLVETQVQHQLVDDAGCVF
jgi:hypothetical protein